MANHTSLASLFTDIANAIRAKLGSNANIVADNFPAAIQSIAPTLQTVTKTYTPTESAQTDTITPSSGYDGIDEVDVTVNAISPTYVGRGITRRSSSDLSASGATVTAPAGYYQDAASKAVQSGTAGTPTASKGAVSNHQVTVTPSVQNTEGYISGGTKTGTGVVVTAAELVSGSETKTQNGTFDVTNLAELVVNVSGGGGSGLEYESGTITLASQSSTITVPFSNSHNTAPMFFMIAENGGAQPSVATGTNPYVYIYSNWANCFGNPVYATASSILSGRATVLAKTKTATTFSTNNTDVVTTSTEVTATGATINRSSWRQSWLANVPYKWIAVWAPTT